MGAEIGTAYLPVEGDFGPLNRAVAALGPKLNAKLGKVGKVAGVGLGAAVVGGFAAGKFLYDIGAEFDEAFDKIRVGTGKTGKPLKALQRDFKAVVAGVPAEFGDAGTAVADLNSRLGLTGKPLRGLSRQMLELSRITETDVGENVKASTRAFADWEVGTKNQGKALDFLFRASQASGATVGELSELVVQFGAPLRQVGFDLEEAASMFALFEKSGVNIQTMMPGLKMALKNFFLEDRDPEKALAKTFEGIEKGTISTSKALEIFGQRAGADMVEAIKQGRFEFQDFTRAVAEGNDTIMKAGRETRDLPEHWQVFKNRMMVILEPLASKVFNKLGDAMREVGDILTDPKLSKNEKFSRVSDMLVDAVGDALPRMAEKAGQGGAIIAKGLAKGLMGADTLSRLIIGAGLIRLLGGRGALLGSGAAAGRFLGLGIGAGAASAAISGGAGGAAAGGLAGGIMSKLKSVRWARVGGVGLGLALADATISEFGRRAQMRSDDLGEALKGFSGPKILGADVFGFLDKAPLGLDFLKPDEKAARNLSAQYEEMLSKRVRLSRVTISNLAHQAKEIDLTKEQRSQVERMFAVMRQGRRLKVGADLGMDPKKLSDIHQGFRFLKRGIGTNMADINRVTKRTGRLIATTFGRDTKESRQLAARNMRATATAIEQQMERSGKETKEGMQRVRELIRNANLIAPSRQQAQGFGREWAKAMEGSKKETREGVADMIREARKMPGPMRQVALQSWLEQAKQAKRSGDITTGEFRKMRSRVLSEFGAIKKGVGLDSKKLADGVISNVDRLVNTTGDALQILRENVSSALSAFGVEPQKFTVKTTSGGKRGRGQEKQLGGFIVPGTGSGDKVRTALPPGSFIENREAVKALPFAAGGLMPVALEPGERVYLPKAVEAIGRRTLKARNKAVPRFQKGGQIGKPALEGPMGPLRDIGRGAVDKVFEAAKEYIAEKRPEGMLGGVPGFSGPPPNFKQLGDNAWVDSHTARVAAFLSKKFGVPITDGWRPQNASYGAANSSHKRGSPANPGAFDFGPSQGLLAFAKQRIAGLLEAMIHDEGSGLHTHIAFFREGGPLQRLASGGLVDLVGSHWDNDELATLAHIVGMKSPGRMAQKAQGESRGNEKAVGHDPGGTEGLGLWQVTTGYNDDLITKYGGRSAMLTAGPNAKAAKEIQDKQGMGAWYAPFVGPVGQVSSKLVEKMRAVIGGQGIELTEGQEKAREGKRRKASYESTLEKLRQRVAGSKSLPAKQSALWKLIKFWGRVGIFDKGERSHILDTVQDAASKVNPEGTVGILSHLASFARKTGEITGRDPDDWHSLTDAIEKAQGRGQKERERTVEKHKNQRQRKVSRIASRGNFEDLAAALKAHEAEYDQANQGAERLVALEPEDLTDAYVGQERGAWSGVLERLAAWRDKTVETRDFASSRIPEWQDQLDKIKELAKTHPKAFKKQKWRIPALREAIANAQAFIEERRENLLDFQGFGGPEGMLGSLGEGTPWWLTLGGPGARIFDTQNTIRELSIKVGAGADGGKDDSERASLLEELLRQANQRTAVSEAQRGAIEGWDEMRRGFSSLPPFGGIAHTGAIVPGPRGAERTMVLKSREGVFTEEQMAAMGRAGGSAVPEVVVNGDIVQAPGDTRDPVEMVLGDRRFVPAVEKGVSRMPGVGRMTPGGTRF